MERRKLLKSLGVLSITGLGISLFNSCDTKTKQDTKSKENIIQKTGPAKNRKLMKIKDPEHPTTLELKHTPEITLGDKDAKGFTKVEITVGSKGIIHPAKKDHWIDYLKLYKDNELVGNLVIEPGMARGFSGFRIKLDRAKKLKAVIGCNIHGVWENTITL